MVRHVDQALAPFVARVADHKRCDRFHLLGTSGTVTTIAGVHLDLPRYDRRAIDGLWMTSGEVDAAVDRLRAMSYADRVANGCIGAERADLVLAGCAILEAIRARFPANRVRIADRGLREGILVANDAGRSRGAARAGGRQGRGMTGGGSGREGGRALKTRVKTARKAQPVLDVVARAPAQRSLSSPGQARGLSLPRGL